MDLALKGMPTWKRRTYKVLSWSLGPTIYSFATFGYIGIPTNIQEMIRHQLPLEFRSYLLSHFTIEQWFTFLFFSAVACVLWGSLGGYLKGSLLKKANKRISDENTKLAEENEQLIAQNDSNSINCYQFFSRYIYNNYYSKFKLTANERISLYKLDMEMFSCVGRYSDNEVYKTKPNRFYPRNIGCIERVWKQGYFQHVIPHNPKEALDAWNQYNIDEFGFELEVLQRIKMKSQSLQGFRIQNEKQETVAVLIFESTDKTGLKFEKIKAVMREGAAREQKNLCHLLEALENHMPSLESAHSEGF
ncbi:hypothetical protein NMT47_000042 [Vibrio cholerae]|nr:hypothetical protein [Vibrio cholerae]